MPTDKGYKKFPSFYRDDDSRFSVVLAGGTN